MGDDSGYDAGFSFPECTDRSGLVILRAIWCIHISWGTVYMGRPGRLTMRLESTTKVLPKRMLNYYRISQGALASVFQRLGGKLCSEGMKKPTAGKMETWYNVIIRSLLSALLQGLVVLWSQVYLANTVATMLKPDLLADCHHLHHHHQADCLCSSLATHQSSCGCCHLNVPPNHLA